MSKNDPSSSSSRWTHRASTDGIQDLGRGGGVRFTGHVVHPDAFLEESLPTRDLQDRYREGQRPLTEAEGYLHLIASEGPDWAGRTNRHVRFRMDGIDAWWAE